MLKSCPFCKEVFGTTTAYRDHLRNEHPLEKAFGCHACQKRFSHSASLQKHVRKEHAECTVIADVQDSAVPSSSVQGPAGSPPDGDGGRPAGSPPPDQGGLPKLERSMDWRDMETGSTAASFDEWLRAYQAMAAVNSDAVPMADSTKSNILNDIETVKRQQPELLLLAGDPSEFSEVLDSYIDRFFFQTMVKRVRSVRWYVRYLVNTDPSVHLETLEDLDTTVKDLQSVCTIDIANRGILAVTDPYDLGRITNEVVRALARYRKVTVDPFLEDFFRRDEDQQQRARPDRDALVAFGMGLRCFIELGIRFTNVPMRIQCTRHLEMWDSAPPGRTGGGGGDSYVSKLVLHGGHFARNVLHDKTGRTTQAVTIPMCEHLSGYLLFYAVHCRPDPGSPWVFQARRGGPWTSASADLKLFLAGLDVDCGQICSNGRFVHGSRHLSLAVFSILSNYDLTSIRNYAILMRHSLATVEHVYSPWLKLQQSKLAAEDVFRLRGLEAPGTRRRVFQAENLPTPSNAIRLGFRKMFEAAFGSTYQPEQGPFGFTSAGTQTEDVHDPVLSTTPVPPATCGPCGGTRTVLHGPVANTKKRKRFGCYYRKCPDCRQEYFYDLAYSPGEGEASVSYTPRNLAAVLAHRKKTLEGEQR